MRDDKEGKLYLNDMNFAQNYASLNRRVIAKILLSYFDLNDIEQVESIRSTHNYINFKDSIIRKGAISAYDGERVVIPLNMKDGTIIGRGKSQKGWNYSAPHGAGRVLSRHAARKRLNLDEYRRVMRGVWSSCVNKHTIDESPMAYKSKSEIIKHLGSTVDIDFIMKPLYNFKAN